MTKVLHHAELLASAQGGDHEEKAASAIDPCRRVADRRRAHRDGQREARRHGVTDIGCGIDLNGVPPFVAFTDNARIVATPRGRAVLVCHAEIPTGPSSAVIIEDLLCLVGPAGVTDQSHTVITPSGKALLTCHINPSDLAQLAGAAAGSILIARRFARDAVSSRRPRSGLSG